MTDFDLHNHLTAFSMSGVKESIKRNPDDIDKIDPKVGWPPLYKALVYEQKDFMKLLLDSGANPNVTNRIGESSLHYAVETEKLDVVQMLICYGARVDIQQNDGDTPIHIACKNNNIKMVRELLKSQNINLNLQNKLGKTVLHICGENNSTELSNLLQAHGADPNICDKWKKKPNVIPYAMEKKDTPRFDDSYRNTENKENQNPNFDLNFSDITINNNNNLNKSSLESDSLKLPFTKIEFPKDKTITPSSTNSSTSTLPLNSNTTRNNNEKRNNNSSKISSFLERQDKNDTLKRKILSDITEQANSKYNISTNSQARQFTQASSEVTEIPLSNLPSSNCSLIDQQDNISVASSLTLGLKKKDSFKKLNFKNNKQNIKKNLLSIEILDEEAEQKIETESTFQQIKTTNKKNTPSNFALEQSSIKIDNPFLDSVAKDNTEHEIQRDLSGLRGPSGFAFQSTNDTTEDQKFLPTEHSKQQSCSASTILNNNLQNIFFDPQQAQTQRNEEEFKQCELAQKLASQNQAQNGIFNFDNSYSQKVQIMSDQAMQNLDSKQGDKNEITKRPKLPEEQNIGEWLENIELVELVPNFTDNGFKTFFKFKKEYEHSNSLFQDLLYRFGVDKIGYRLRIWMKFEEECHRFKREGLFQYNRVKPDDKLEYPTVDEWLYNIGYERYIEQFFDNGFDDLEYLILQTNFKLRPLDEFMMRDIIGIESINVRRDMVKRLKKVYNAASLTDPLSFVPEKFTKFLCTNQQCSNCKIF